MRRQNLYRSGAGRRNAAAGAAPGRVLHPCRLRRQGAVRQMPGDGQRRVPPGLQDRSLRRRRGDAAGDGRRRDPHGHGVHRRFRRERAGLCRRRGPGHDHGGRAALRPGLRPGAEDRQRLERAGILRRGRHQPYPVHPGRAGRPDRAVRPRPLAGIGAGVRLPCRCGLPGGYPAAGIGGGQHRYAAPLCRAAGALHRRRALRAPVAF